MPEIFGSTTYYGIGRILRQYSGFPSFVPMPVNVQHGFVGARISSHDARRDAPENWFWDEETMRSHMRSFPGIRGRAVGAPFLYLLQNLRYSGLHEAQRRGTIVFPSHSSAFIKVAADFDLFADQLCRLPEKFLPVTICAYHIDLDRGVYKPFVDRGFEIVTNGRSLYEESFMNNFISNVMDKKYAISNQISTSLYFSSALGLISYQLGPVPDFVDNKDPHHLKTDLKDEEIKDRDAFGEYFRFPDALPDAQRDLVSRLLGRGSLLSPREMNRLLWRHTLSMKYLAALVKYSVISLLIRLKRLLGIPSLRSLKRGA